MLVMLMWKSKILSGFHDHGHHSVYSQMFQEENMPWAQPVSIKIVKSSSYKNHTVIP